jgi:hypothetical protein
LKQESLRNKSRFYIVLFESGIMETICNIEIIKEGTDYVARVHLSYGKVREYRHHSFEEVLTELIKDLHDDISEKYF